MTQMRITVKAMKDGTERTAQDFSGICDVLFC